MHIEARTGGFGTVTRLNFGDVDAAADASAALRGLLAHVSRQPGFTTGHLLRTSETELVLITIYGSQEAAEQLSAEFRPRLGDAVGRLVVGHPERWVGTVELSTGS